MSDDADPVPHWLAAQGLREYAAPMAAEGFVGDDCLAELQALSRPQLLELCASFKPRPAAAAPVAAAAASPPDGCFVTAAAPAAGRTVALTFAAEGPLGLEFEVVNDEQLAVGQIKPDGWAAAHVAEGAALRVGHVLAAIDGQRTTTAAETLVRLKHCGRPVTLEFAAAVPQKRGQQQRSQKSAQRPTAQS
eukprot:COSAG04_NODE_4608_length_1990_cov_1.516129_3_plen_191_part_00